jgi:cytochrome c553
LRSSPQAGLRTEGRFHDQRQVSIELRGTGRSVDVPALSSATHGRTIRGTAGDRKGLHACHRVNGQDYDVETPTIAAQSLIYLYNQLIAFRAGKRKHPIMKTIARSLTDREIEQIVTYYSNYRRLDAGLTGARM